MDWKDTIKSVV